MLTTYSTARSKAHKRNTAAALEKKSFPFPTGRMRENRRVWSTCSPTKRSLAAITTIIAGITGSASGGLTIALELFGETFISWGYTPEIIHRVASIACGGLDTLPWNGTVVMLFALSGVSYKKGYKHVAMETVILPLLSLIPVFIYYSIVH